MSDFWTGVIVTVVALTAAYWVYGCVQDGLHEYRRYGGAK